MTSGKINLVMAVMGFVFSMLFIVFICARLICARFQLRASARFQRHLPSTSSLSSLERGLQGIEPTMIANFPVKKHEDEYFAAAENEQCSICLGEYQKEDVMRILPYCGHYFHIKCIDLWFLQHCTCPVCRISLRETSQKKHSMQLLSSYRSQYNTDSCGQYSHHCRTSETHRSEPIEEDQHLSLVSIKAGEKK